MFPEASKRKFLELHGLVKPVGDIRMLLYPAVLEAAANYHVMVT